MSPDHHLGYLVRTRALELFEDLLGSRHQLVQLGQLMGTPVWRLSKVMPPPLTLRGELRGWLGGLLLFRG